MSCISHYWQQYVLRIITLTTICLTYHNTNNNISYVSVIRKTYCCQFCDTLDILLILLWYVRDIVVSTVMRKSKSYVSQHYQQYVLHITLLTTICLTHHNIDARHSVVSVVVYKTHCCQCCDAYDILVKVMWHVRHIVVSVVIHKT
jgi:hypothetical protein